jgi:hypothetical protein
MKQFFYFVTFVSFWEKLSLGETALEANKKSKSLK